MKVKFRGHYHAVIAEAKGHTTKERLELHAPYASLRAIGDDQSPDVDNAFTTNEKLQLSVRLSSVIQAESLCNCRTSASFPAE